MIKIIDSIVAKVVFSNQLIAINEIKKAAFLRILTGFIILIRFVQIFVVSYALEGRSIHNGLLFIFISVSILFTVGFLTPIVNFLLIISLPLIDNLFDTNTLGSTIAINLLVVNILLNSGQYFSIDKWIINQRNKTSNLFISIYKIIGIPNEQEIKRVYFLSFCLYAISSFYALIIHVQDDYWMNGITVKAMLTNSFLCKHALLFRNIESNMPFLIDFISVSGVIFQSIFQILMIPLVFTRIGKVFVVVWGFIFFSISLLFLSLSYLPHLEIIIWFIIFCPIVTSQDKIQILYDDKCNLCKKALKFFKTFNINGMYEFMPISKNQSFITEHALNNDDLIINMTGIYKQKIYKGYDLYALIFLNNPILCVLYPFFLIGKITKIGYLVYGYISKNRYKIFGVCQISYFDEIQKNLDFPVSKGYSKGVMYFFNSYTIMILLFILLNNSLFSKIITPQFFSNYKHIGIEVPDVFNKTDLSMGDNFMVVKKQINNNWVLVPITGINGERLNYLNFDILLFSNHNSDILYFSQTLKYRRKLIHQLNNVVYFHEHGFGKSHINFLINYDYYKCKYTHPVIYTIEVYSSKASHALLFKNNITRFNTHLIYNKNILYSKSIKL